MISFTLITHTGNPENFEKVDNNYMMEHPCHEILCCDEKKNKQTKKNEGIIDTHKDMTEFLGNCI